MKRLILPIAIAIIFVACKKEDLQPQTIVTEKTVYKHDTIKKSDTIHIINNDTSIILADPLQGVWQVYKLETYVNGQLSTTETPNWKFRFYPDQLIETKNNTSITYKINLNSNYLGIYDNGSNASPYIVKSTNNGTEYKITQYPNTVNYTIWYLKR